MARFSVKLLGGPQDELTTLFEELQLNVEAQHIWAQPRNQWISTPTCATTAGKAAEAGRPSHRKANHCSRETTQNAQWWLQRKSKGTWRLENQRKHGGALRGDTKLPPIARQKASKMSLAAQTAERVALYGKGVSKVDPLPVHVDKSDIPDDIPSDGELRTVVRELQNGRAAGLTGLQAEHIKVWLSDVVREEEEQSNVGLGHKWRVFVRLMQVVWEHGSVPKQMRWVPGCGMGTASIKAKLAQSLAWCDQCPLYQIYMDLNNTYDVLDREQMLDILVAYGVKPRMLRLQKHFWDTA
jgi:hypothetical protein